MAGRFSRNATVRDVVIWAEMFLLLIYTTAWLVTGFLLNTALKPAGVPSGLNPRSLIDASIGIPVFSDGGIEVSAAQSWARWLSVGAAIGLVVLAVAGFPRILVGRAVVARTLLAGSLLGAPLALTALLADPSADSVLLERLDPWYRFSIGGLSGIPGTWLLATVLSALLVARASHGLARIISIGSAAVLLGLSLVGIRRSSGLVGVGWFLSEQAAGLFTLVTFAWLVALCWLALGDRIGLIEEPETSWRSTTSGH